MRGRLRPAGNVARVAAPRGVRIVNLVEAPGAMPVLERWFVEEWAPWYGPGGPGDAGEDLRACRNHGHLPFCLVAVDVLGNPVGTAALRSRSAGDDVAAGPFLTGLLVAAPHRGRGIATALVAAVEAEAARLGFRAIYCSTDSAAGLLVRRGWRPVGRTSSLRGAVTVHRRDLE